VPPPPCPQLGIHGGNVLYSCLFTLSQNNKHNVFSVNPSGSKNKLRLLSQAACAFSPYQETKRRRDYKKNRLLRARDLVKSDAERSREIRTHHFLVLGSNFQAACPPRADFYKYKREHRLFLHYLSGQ
jgi:hypothetical protein